MSNYQFDILPMLVKALLEEIKAGDTLFAEEVRIKESRTEKPKSLTECCDYMRGEFYSWALENKTGNASFGGCDSEQLKEMIIHYYDEDDIEIKKVGAGAKMTTKVVKPQKPARPKETLDNTHVEMLRPKNTKDAKEGAKEQAKHVHQLDIFSMLAGVEVNDDEPKDEDEELDEVEKEMFLDDLPDD